MPATILAIAGVKEEFMADSDSRALQAAIASYVSFVQSAMLALFMDSTPKQCRRQLSPSMSYFPLASVMPYILVGDDAHQLRLDAFHGHSRELEKQMRWQRSHLQL
jgi:hypothetical protein